MQIITRFTSGTAVPILQNVNEKILAITTLSLNELAWLN